MKDEGSTFVTWKPTINCGPRSRTHCELLGIRGTIHYLPGNLDPPLFGYESDDAKKPPATDPKK